MGYFPQIKDIAAARMNLKGVVDTSPLQENLNLSERFGATVLLKREDLLPVRSYKLRGAFNKMKGLSRNECQSGIVCASAGNHAQGVAYACRMLGIHGRIYMPATTPKQKITQVRMFGKEHIEIFLTGDTFDASNAAALADCKSSGRCFIHPFNDPQIIEGQGTVGMEILEQTNAAIDYMFVPVGGGGLISGLGAWVKAMSPNTRIIGVEPSGAPSMTRSLEAGSVITLEEIDKFVDGAAVKRVGDLNFEIAKVVIDQMVLVPEGRICTKILELYNQDAIVVEPAGALSIAALDSLREEIRGKTVVCIVSGSNNDITRTEEMKERSLLYEGLKHYFIVSFPQRAGALRIFTDQVLGPSDDITYFEYRKKTSRENGPAVIGIELQNREDFSGLIERLEAHGFVFEYLNEKPDLFSFLI